LENNKLIHSKVNAIDTTSMTLDDNDNDDKDDNDYQNDKEKE
jgi:hypothetical protein